jgi:hypothetical protein
MPKVLRRPALALAIAACAFCASAPAASANPGDFIGQVIAPEATNGVSVAFDGQILYYTNIGEDVIHRVTPQGVVLPDIVVHGLAPLAGIATLTYDVTNDKFWAVDDLTGRQIYLIDKLGNAVLKSVVTDDQLALNGLPGTECGTGFCDFLVDGLAFDAQSDTLWWSPDESHVIYHFDPFGGGPGVVDVTDLGVTVPVAQQLGYYRIDNPDKSSMAPYCEPPFSSGIAVGDHGGPDSTGSPSAIMYDFAGPCRTWFKYLGDNDNTPQLLAAYPTVPPPPPPATMNDAEDDECDNVTFKVPVVWLRSHDDDILRAFETSTCFVGGGVPIQDKNRMTGGGGLPILWPTTDAGKSAHHGLMIHCFSFIQPDNLEINWGKGNSFHMTHLTTSTCDNDPNATGSSGASFNRIQGSGTGRLNGVEGATATWSFTDNGEPGTKDHGSLMVTTPFGATCIVPNDPLDYTDGCVAMKADGFLTKDSPLIGEGNYQSHQGH